MKWLRSLFLREVRTCDPDIYEHGVCIGVIASMPPEAIELICKRMTVDSGQPIDWHYFGGRARILTTGNVSEAQMCLPQVMRTDIR